MSDIKVDINNRSLINLFCKLPFKWLRFIVAVPVAAIVATAVAVIMFCFAFMQVVSDAVNGEGNKNEPT